MSDMKDFVIENGELKKYVGPGGDVEIPDGVTSIGDGAFLDCSSLKSVAIPEGVTSIDNQTFYNCISLASVTISDSVTSIGEMAFGCCCSLKYIELPKNLLSIGRGAFVECSSLASMIVPESVNKIGDWAFRNCGSLTSATIPRCMKSIAKELFFGCGSLKALTIPDGVTDIGKNAFNGCSKLTVMTIPKSVTDIGKEAFLNCSGLRSVACDTKWESAFNLCGAENDFLFGDAELEGVLKKVALKRIQSKKGAYFDEILKKNSGSATTKFLHAWKKVSVNDLDAYLNSAMEKGCTEVTVALLDYKNKVYSAQDLETHQMQQVEKEIGIRDKTYRYWQKIFKFSPCFGSEDELEIKAYKAEDPVVVIPEKVGKYTVVKIGYEAFANCEKLTSITIPDSVTSIGGSAFSTCRSLTSVTIPDSVTSIGAFAFSGCTSLTSVTIPSSVKSIGREAFSDCKSLVIDSNNPNYSSDEYGCLFDKNKTTLINYPTGNCRSNYVIPASVKRIGSWAFSPCSSLTSVTIPDSVTSIGAFAFSGCTSLTSVTIGDSVKSIGGSAFSTCRSLTSVTIPDSVTSIDQKAFWGCKNLTIHAKAKSYAVQFAKQLDIPFVEE